MDRLPNHLGGDDLGAPNVCSVSETRKGAKGRDSAPLGTTETTAHHEVRALSSKDAKAAYFRSLWSLQRTMWEITQIKRLAGCHRWRAPGSAVARVDWSETSTRWGGLQDSHSVWASPVSAARIGAVRAREVRHALTEWMGTEEEPTGRGVAFLTLTMRHHSGQTLRDVWDTLLNSWHSVMRSAAWRGGARTPGDAKRFGVAHWVRVVEVTHGKNGWHAHIHALMFMDKALSDQQREELEGRFFARWSAAVQRRGFEAPSRERGARIDIATRSGDLDALSSYLAKSQFDGVKGLADELTGSVVKRARGENLTPFQVLEAIPNATGDERADLVKIWQIWERESTGRRQFGWSAGAKDALGVTDLKDEDIIDGLDEEFARTAYTVARVSAGQWQKIQSDTDLRLAVIEHVKEATTPKGARRRARQILTSLGIDHESVLIELDPDPGDKGPPPVDKEGACYPLKIDPEIKT